MEPVNALDGHAQLGALERGRLHLVVLLLGEVVLLPHGLAVIARSVSATEQSLKQEN